MEAALPIRPASVSFDTIHRKKVAVLPNVAGDVSRRASHLQRAIRGISPSLKFAQSLARLWSACGGERASSFGDQLLTGISCWVKVLAGARTKAPNSGRAEFGAFLQMQLAGGMEYRSASVDRSQL